MFNLVSKKDLYKELDTFLDLLEIIDRRIDALTVISNLETKKRRNSINKLNKTIDDLHIYKAKVKTKILNMPKVKPKRTNKEYLEGFNYAWDSLTKYLNDLWM